MSGTTTKGAWRLQDVRDNILKGEWITYNVSNDPGTLWSWGYNFFGQLGDNTVTCMSSPIQVPGTQWTEVDGGGKYTTARKSDGTLWSWGGGIQGQLGHNTATCMSSPIQVPGTQWTEVSGGFRHTTARKSV